MTFLILHGEASLTALEGGKPPSATQYRNEERAFID
jgi:hypothetical protein